MERKEAFDSIAKWYDARPPYNSEIFDKLISETRINSNSHILEIGSGTGKATYEFLRRGFVIECIEPGKQLLEVFKKKLSNFLHQTVLYNQSFEEWLNLDYPYDLIIAAQSLHWIDTKIRYTKPYLLLKKGGYLCEVFNYFLDDNEQFRKETYKTIKKYCPEFVISEHESLKEILKTRKDGLNKMKLFRQNHSMKLIWTYNQSIEEYIISLRSWSKYCLISQDIKDKIEIDLLTNLQNTDKSVTRKIATCLMLSQK